MVTEDDLVSIFKCKFEMKLEVLSVCEEWTTELLRKIIFPLRLKMKIRKAGPALQEEVHVGIFKQEFERTTSRVIPAVEHPVNLDDSIEL